MTSNEADHHNSAKLLNWAARLRMRSAILLSTNFEIEEIDDQISELREQRTRLETVRARHQTLLLQQITRETTP